MVSRQVLGHDIVSTAIASENSALLNPSGPCRHCSNAVLSLSLFVHANKCLLLDLCCLESVSLSTASLTSSVLDNCSSCPPIFSSFSCTFSTILEWIEFIVFVQVCVTLVYLFFQRVPRMLEFHSSS